jgi:hypothetical protein
MTTPTEKRVSALVDARRRGVAGNEEKRGHDEHVGDVNFDDG